MAHKLLKIPVVEKRDCVINEIIDQLNDVIEHGGGGGATGFYVGTKEQRLALDAQNGYEFNQVEEDGTVHRYCYEHDEWVLLSNPDEHDTEEVIIALSTNFGTIDFSTLEIYVTNNNTGVRHLIDIDSTGTGIIYIPIGDEYTVEYPEVEGFTSPDNVTIIAERYVRQINAVYVMENASSTFYIMRNISDPDSKVIHEDGGTFGKDGTVDNNVVTWIRANSHAYVGTWDTINDTMNLKQLSDTDFEMYADNTSAEDDIKDIHSLGSDVFVKLPEFWYRSKVESSYIEFSFSKNEQPGYQHWDSKFLIGAYEATVINNMVRSLSGKNPTGNVSQQNFKQYSRNRNQSINLPANNGYSLIKFVPHSVLGFLFYAYYGSTNCQSKCGSGTSSNDKLTGTRNSLGMTDTDGSNGNSGSIKFWGLENWWGNKYEWLDDIVSVDAQGTCNILNLDGSIADQINVVNTNGQWVRISDINPGNKMYLCPSAASGTDFTTEYADGVNVSPASGLVAFRSGDEAYPNGGVGCLYVIYAPSYASPNIGSRLLYYGPQNIITD